MEAKAIKLFNRLSLECERISKKLEYSGCDENIFQYTDCFVTIDTLIKLTKPKYLCDIGANNGLWAYVLQQMNPNLEHIVFFEPQTQYQEKLQKLSFPNITKVIYPCGLGDQKEELAIKGGTASASFFDVEQQTEYFPDSLSDKQESVEIHLLDEIYAQDNLPTPDLIKLDVQGFELNVLKGGINTLRKTKYLVIELSFRQFYKNQPSIWEIFKFLQENNFIMIGKGFEWRSPKQPSEILQMDAIFMNNNLS
jgi:FkbM family methyltransferase